MSAEIVAQPGLTKAECDVLCMGLELFEEFLKNAQTGQVVSMQGAIKKEQAFLVIANARAKIVRSAVKMGALPDARNINPGGSFASRTGRKN